MATLAFFSGRFYVHSQCKIHDEGQIYLEYFWNVEKCALVKGEVCADPF